MLIMANAGCHHACLLSRRSDLHTEVYKVQILRQALWTRDAATLQKVAHKTARCFQRMQRQWNTETQRSWTVSVETN